MQSWFRSKPLCLKGSIYYYYFNSCNFEYVKNMFCLGWVTLALIASFLIRDISVDGAQNFARNISSATDDIDDFIPYQGERFNAFDWNLFKVNFYFNLAIYLYLINYF